MSHPWRSEPGIALLAPVATVEEALRFQAGYSFLYMNNVVRPNSHIDRTIKDFHARVVQHEVDHLDGILYPRRIRDLRQFGFTAALFPGEELADD